MGFMKIFLFLYGVIFLVVKNIMGGDFLGIFT